MDARETQVTSGIAGLSQIGSMSLAVTLLIAGLCGETAAKTVKGRLHARSLTSQNSVQPVAQQPVQLGATRYYGGPKSPMWRGPSEN
jgi:hypothetical protein